MQQLMVEYLIFFQENEQFDKLLRLTVVNVQRVFNQESTRYSKSAKYDNEVAQTGVFKNGGVTFWILTP